MHVCGSNGEAKLLSYVIVANSQVSRFVAQDGILVALGEHTILSLRVKQCKGGRDERRSFFSVCARRGTTTI